MLNSTASNPGDLNRFEVSLNGKDVSAAVLSAHLFFDIVGGVWTAQIFFDDSTNLMSTLPIASGAKVKIKAETKLDSAGDEEKEFEYVVYNVTDKVAVNHMHYTYTVHCAAPAFILDQKTRVQKYYEGTASSAISSICSEFLGASVAETRESEGSVQFIGSNWTPLNTISWASKWARYSGKADYLFFQSDNGEFSFLPLSVMFGDERKTGLTFIQRPQGIRKNGEPEGDPCLRFSAYQVDHYDALQASLQGYFASKNAKFDFVKKKWTVDEFTAEGAEGGDNEFADMGNANLSFTPFHPGMYQGQDNIYDTSKDWTGSRRAELQKVEREKIVFQIPAAVACYRWLGKNIKIDLPSQEDMTEDPHDKLRRGKYLVTAISLMLNKADAVTNIEAAKIELEGE